ncbi:hypothetical protein WA026_002342 [Henosepilachna vigintioctopunctata]|uniref:Uncharacterized protein n=1 Tax=Henosepilachna vigintioctopunctata TaxID=420089 RepID=A0AAW1TT97_9CUCU
MKQLITTLHKNELVSADHVWRTDFWNSISRLCFVTEDRQRKEHAPLTCDPESHEFHILHYAVVSWLVAVGFNYDFVRSHSRLSCLFIEEKVLSLVWQSKVTSAILFVSYEEAKLVFRNHFRIGRMKHKNEIIARKYRSRIKNVTVHIKVSNDTNPWKKLYIRQARNSNEFLKNDNVRIISFKNQKIPVLLTNTFRDIYRIKKINLNNCGIEELEPGFIKNVTRIFEFDVSHNSIREIQYDVFNNVGISKLRLNNNKIYRIDSEAFSNMKHLEMIILSENRLTMWDPLGL